MQPKSAASVAHEYDEDVPAQLQQTLGVEAIQRLSIDDVMLDPKVWPAARWALGANGQRCGPVACPAYALVRGRGRELGAIAAHG